MIETERLVLRKMNEEDVGPLLDIFSDPVAMRHFGVVFDRPRMDRWMSDNLQHEQQHGFSLRSVVLKDNGEVIGDCGLETDEIDGQIIVGIGFNFRRSYWGKGYATEAASAVLNYGFTHFDFESISGWIDPENKPSQRVAERIGMTVDRYVMRGKKKYALYTIRKEDWEVANRSRA
jgi:RimJ/RimL family protein N-acetyltransferase